MTCDGTLAALGRWYDRRLSSRRPGFNIVEAKPIGKA